MRETGGRGRLLGRLVLPLCAAALLAGCASMPSSGEVRKVGDTQRADADTQVRVHPVAPHAGETPSEIIDGFLEAVTTTDTSFAVAKEYLTRDVAPHWDPLKKITVYSGSLTSGPGDTISPKDGYAKVTRSGAKAAMVDPKHAYQPDQGPFSATFHLTRQNNQWRIDGLDDGLMLSETDFGLIYHSASMYYFANLGPDGGSQQTLVPDPVYLPNQIDPLVSTVSALLGGPTESLAPVVSSAAPAGTQLYGQGPDQGVSLDDSQHLRVRLDNRSADKVRGQNCVRLAAQLIATVQAQASAKLAMAEVDRADGTTVCTLPADQTSYYGPNNLVGSGTHPYYISADSQRRLMVLSSGSEKDPSPSATAVPGPFGAAKADLDAVAVRRDESMAAGVRNGGRDLVVGPLSPSGSFHTAVLTSRAPNADDGLSAPSWDGFGDLWVADRDPGNPKLMVLPDGSGPPVEVTVSGLAGRVDSLRVSSDGVRIAVLVEQGGQQTLQIGLIERGGRPGHPTFAVSGLRTLTPAGETIASVSWAGASRLVVLDSKTGGVQQTEYINSDGSVSTVLQGGVSEAVSIAASENPSRPLLASYKNSVYLLSADGDWKQVQPKGVSPVYPG